MIIRPLDHRIPVEPLPCGIPAIVHTFQSYKRKPSGVQCRHWSQFAPHQLLCRLGHDRPDILFPQGGDLTCGVRSRGFIGFIICLVTGANLHHINCVRDSKSLASYSCQRWMDWSYREHKFASTSGIVSNVVIGANLNPMTGPGP